MRRRGWGAKGSQPTTTEVLVLPIADETCLTCHTDFSQVTGGENPKEFSHQLHVKQRITCSTCHAAVGHEGAPLPDPALCAACHGIDMPHPADFQQGHGALVVQQGGEVCGRCHNVYLHCQECHGLQMPHPAQWTEKHGQIAYPQMQVCSRCHEKDYCLRCHPVEMPHPAGWTSAHGVVVAEKGSNICTRCHEPKLCAACHGTPMPHAADWGTTHQDAARSDRESCLLCHAVEDCTACHDLHRTHGQGGGA
ncbi:MAG: cytochrome c3 family protein [Thermoleophilia bacterium]|nr:cytochrome c3 family protein [Thermoleophilia bacterium]